MKNNYVCKYIYLSHPYEEENDLYEFPEYSFFADKEELGEMVEVVMYEYTVFNGHCITSKKLIHRTEANKYYKYLTNIGYKVDNRAI